MNYHVFIVNTTTLKVHIEHQFAGTGAQDKKVPFLADSNIVMQSTTERNLTGMIADISRIRKSDKIIFYLQQDDNHPGTFFGIFKATSDAFFDENDIDNYLKDVLNKGLTFRIHIAPDEVFSQGITEHEYLDSLDGKNFPHQLCWSLIYRKLKGNRGCTMITDYEFNDLRNKLIKKNCHKIDAMSYTYSSAKNRICPTDVQPQTYMGRTDSLNILNRLLYKANKLNAFEAHLQAYILQNFDKENDLSRLLLTKGSEYWIGNEVSCGVGMQRIDILINEVVDSDVFLKVIELKYVEPEEYIITSQLPWYITWLCDYVVPNYSNYNVHIMPYIIAKKTTNAQIIDKVLTTDLQADHTNAYIHKAKLIGFTTSKNGISFEEQQKTE